MFPNDSEIWGGDADGDELKEECGVIGIHAPDQTARLAFFALYTSSIEAKRRPVWRRSTMASRMSTRAKVSSPPCSTRTTSPR